MDGTKIGGGNKNLNQYRDPRRKTWRGMMREGGAAPKEQELVDKKSKAVE